MIYIINIFLCASFATFEDTLTFADSYGNKIAENIKTENNSFKYYSEVFKHLNCVYLNFKQEQKCQIIENFLKDFNKCWIVNEVVFTISTIFQQMYEDENLKQKLNLEKFAFFFLSSHSSTTTTTRSVK